MKKVPTVYLPGKDMFIRVGDLIVWCIDESSPAGIAGNHDVLKIVKMLTGTRASVTTVALEFECIDCGMEDEWSGNRGVLASCIRPLTELERKRVMKDIGE